MKGSVRAIYFAVKLTTSVIFFWSGIIKLADPEAFVVTIGAFGIVPDFFVEPLAYILPVFEVILSIMLYLEVRGSLVSVTSLMVFFIIILGYGIHMGLDIDCGCFGPNDPEKRAFSGLKTALYRDFVIMAGLSYMFYYRIKKNK